MLLPGDLPSLSELAHSDRMATTRNIEALIPNLRRYARALCRDRDLADDLVQDTLERALSRFFLWRRGSNLRAWLFTIMHNLHVNGAATRYAPARIAGEDMVAALTDATLPQSDTQSLRETLRALDLLPDDQRRILLLVALEGLSYTEIAAIIGIPIGTVMSRLSRGRETLRRLTDRDAAPPLRRVK